MFEAEVRSLIQRQGVIFLEHPTEMAYYKAKVIYSQGRQFHGKGENQDPESL
jgi:hypothetical protein